MYFQKPSIKFFSIVRGGAGGGGDGSAGCINDFVYDLIVPSVHNTQLCVAFVAVDGGGGGGATVVRAAVPFKSLLMCWILLIRFIATRPTASFTISLFLSSTAPQINHMQLT